MQSTDADKDEALAASTIDTISLHSGSPGSDGTANEISGDGYERETVALAAPSAGTGDDRKRALSSSVDFSGPPAQSVTHVGLWAGSTFRRWKALDAPVAFNADGILRLTTDFAIVVRDPG